jgi:hypothetical protein
MTLKETRLAELDDQLAKAEITEDGLEPNAYRVYVPGAIRQENFVKAKNQDEALAKTKAVLISKIEQAPETSTGEVEIQPQSPGKPAV